MYFAIERYMLVYKLGIHGLYTCIHIIITCHLAVISSISEWSKRNRESTDHWSSNHQRPVLLLVRNLPLTVHYLAALRFWFVHRSLPVQLGQLGPSVSSLALCEKPATARDCTETGTKRRDGTLRPRVVLHQSVANHLYVCYCLFFNYCSYKRHEIHTHHFRDIFVDLDFGKDILYQYIWMTWHSIFIKK